MTNQKLFTGNRKPANRGFFAILVILGVFVALAMVSGDAHAATVWCRCNNSIRDSGFGDGMCNSWSGDYEAYGTSVSNDCLGGGSPVSGTLVDNCHCTSCKANSHPSYWDHPNLYMCDCDPGYYRMGDACHPNPVCTPNCTNKCGGADDGCGGSCNGVCGSNACCGGSCQAPASCNANDCRAQSSDQCSCVNVTSGPCGTGCCNSSATCVPQSTGCAGGTTPGVGTYTCSPCTCQ